MKISEEATAWLRAALDGKKIQWRRLGGDENSWLNATDFARDVSILLSPNYEVRVAPAVIVVNGIEVPAPERVAPGSGERYFVPHLGATNLNHCCYWGQAGGDSDDLRFLDRGLVHLRHESAAAHARALLAHKPG